ncbi:MAG: hypothetical protein IJZ23_02625 [Roseburia sp.]|nr:hypothetical protein [Roseburia sp.]
MTIQLSVTIWTIICFVLLMLILHFLLFKPVLKVMDERRARIEKAREKKAENERLEKEYASMLLEKEKAFLEAQQKQINEEIESIKLDTKKAIVAATEERIRKVDSYRESVNKEQEEILDILNAHGEEIAVIFANSIIKE